MRVHVGVGVLTAKCVCVTTTTNKCICAPNVCTPSIQCVMKSMCVQAFIYCISVPIYYLHNPVYGLCFSWDYLFI